MKFLLILITAISLQATPVIAAPIPGGELPQPEATRKADAQKADFAVLLDMRGNIIKKIKAGEPVVEDRRRLLAKANEFNERWPNSIAGLELAGQVCAALQDIEGLEANYGRIMSIEPDRVRAGLAWAAALHEIDPERSILILRGLQSRSKNNMLYSFALYEYCYKYDQKIIEEDFILLLKDPPDLKVKGLIQALKNYNIDLALEYAKRAHENWPDNQEILFTLADSYRRAGHQEIALEYFDRIDDTLLLRNDIGVAYSDTLFDQQQFTKAMNHLELMEGNEEIFDKKAEVGRVFRITTRPRMIGFWEEEQKNRANDAERGDNPRVRMIINGQPVLIELFEDDAPITVANFISLARSGFYDQTLFHRVHPGGISQGTLPANEGDVMWGPGYSIMNEGGPDRQERHFQGNIAMAKIGQDQEIGSQFYITHSPNVSLNGQGVVFGRVIEGLDTVRAMRGMEVIDRIEIVNIRNHDYDLNVTLENGSLVPWNVWNSLRKADISADGQRSEDP